MPSLYEISIPVFIHALNNLSGILSKGSSYAEAQNIPPTQLIEARLVEDMAALPFQIQRVSDISRNAVARITGLENVVMPDTETTFEELQARVKKTIEYLKNVPEDSMDGKEEKEIVIQTGKNRETEYKWTAETYLLTFALPNLYFHVTTAYNILRHKGVLLGKSDYLGSMN